MIYTSHSPNSSNPVQKLIEIDELIGEIQPTNKLLQGKESVADSVNENSKQIDQFIDKAVPETADVSAIAPLPSREAMIAASMPG